MSDNSGIIVNEVDRIVRYTGNLRNKKVMKLIDNMHSLILKESRDSIHFYLCSYGGDYDAVSSLYDFIKASNTTINTINIGACMSGASLVIASGTGERLAYNNARFMIHGLQNYIPHQSFVDNQIKMDEHDRINKKFIELLSKETGKEIMEVTEDLKRDRYLTAEEALDYGLIDDIIV